MVIPWFSFARSAPADGKARTQNTRPARVVPDGVLLQCRQGAGSRGNPDGQHSPRRLAGPFKTAHAGRRQVTIWRGASAESLIDGGSLSRLGRDEQHSSYSALSHCNHADRVKPVSVSDDLHRGRTARGAARHQGAGWHSGERTDPACDRFVGGIEGRRKSGAQAVGSFSAIWTGDTAKAPRPPWHRPVTDARSTPPSTPASAPSTKTQRTSSRSFGDMSRPAVIMEGHLCPQPRDGSDHTRLPVRSARNTQAMVGRRHPRLGLSNACVAPDVPECAATRTLASRAMPE